MLEAQGGAGKSTLLGEVRAAHDGPSITVTFREPTRHGSFPVLLADAAARSGHSDLAGAIEQARAAELVRIVTTWTAEQPESVLLVVDDVQRADAELTHLLIDLVAQRTDRLRILIAGRLVDERLIGAHGIHVGAAQLRFTPAETAALLGPELTDRLSPTEIALLTERCAGWAAALQLARVRLTRAATTGGSALDREVAALLGDAVTVPHLIEELLAELTPAARTTLASVAGLPRFDDEVLDAVELDVGAPIGADPAASGVDALAALGLPVERLPDGSYRFPDVVADVLRVDPLDERVARAAAELELRRDRPQLALRILRDAHLDDDLAKLLAELPARSSGTLDPVTHASAVASLPPALVDAHPRILIHLSDSYLVNGHLQEYRDAIVRARRSIGDVDPRDTDLDGDALEILAAELSIRLVASNDDSLVPAAQQLSDRRDLPLLARGRLLAAMGRAMASSRTTAALRTGLGAIDEAIAIFDRAGAVAHATTARVLAATFLAWPLGRYDTAMQLLERAVQDARANHRVRIATLPYLAFVLIDLGREAEAEAVLAELRRTANAVGDEPAIGNERAAAFARWGTARLASQRGDADATLAAVQAVRRAEVTLDSSEGAFFLADAAQLLARVDLLDEARMMLAEAQARDPGTTPLITTATAVVAGYAGDLAGFEQALTELDGGAAAEPRDRWRLTLLHAALCHQHGDPRAAALAAMAFEEADQLGAPQLPLVREPGPARAMLPVAASASAAARDLGELSPARIQLLDEVQVEVAGVTTPASGRPLQLLVFLVLTGRDVEVDEAIAALWPGGDRARGRERLRTVLRRLRRDIGELVERHDDRLRLTAGVGSDVADLRAALTQALAPGRAIAADFALALAASQLSPALGDTAWVADARRSLTDQVLDVQDLAADQAQLDGRLDDAVRVLDRALQLDPLAEGRALALARVLAEQGRRARGIEVLEQTRRVLERADRPVGDELDRLLGYLRRIETTAG